jgi:CheY-like chemotaxis protein
MLETSMIEHAVRVIVIEDNADDQELLQRQLRKSGMGSYVRFIADGKEALDFLIGPRAAALDDLIAIFLDLQLPSLGGLELLSRLRATEKLQSVPVIVMTSSNDPEDMDECRRLNVTSYVPKPVSFLAFSKAVADVFRLPRVAADSVPEDDVDSRRNPPLTPGDAV